VEKKSQKRKSRKSLHHRIRLLTTKSLTFLTWATKLIRNKADRMLQATKGKRKQSTKTITSTLASLWNKSRKVSSARMIQDRLRIERSDKVIINTIIISMILLLLFWLQYRLPTHRAYIVLFNPFLHTGQVENMLTITVQLRHFLPIGAEFFHANSTCVNSLVFCWVICARF